MFNSSGLLRKLSVIAACIIWILPTGGLRAEPAAEGVPASTPTKLEAEPGKTDAQAPANLLNVDALLGKVRSDHPMALVLKVELHRGKEAGDPDWICEVKLFQPDGRIMKLFYNARTLTLIETYGQHEDGPRRFRLRHRWRGGRND
jgi:hypothetical protein